MEQPLEFADYLLFTVHNLLLNLDISPLAQRILLLHACSNNSIHKLFKHLQVLSNSMFTLITLGFTVSSLLEILKGIATFAFQPLRIIGFESSSLVVLKLG
jgi:hypothetical protein